MIAGDSKVYLLSDLTTPTTIAELAKAGDFPKAIFTAKDHISVGWLDKVVKMGPARVLNVILDDGAILKVTPDQKFLSLDGTICKAKDLTIGKSLAPLYLSERNSYPLFMEINGYNLNAIATIDAEKQRKVSRMVGEFKHGSRLPNGTSVTHIDGNRQNCHPSNLTITIKPNPTHRKFEHPFAKALQDAIAFIKENGNNHKVAQISDAGEDIVFGCASSSSKNFAVNGVFLGVEEE